MADQVTTNFGFIKPTPSDPGGASTWGVKLNGNFDAIDAAIGNVLVQPGHRLSLASQTPVMSTAITSSAVYLTPHKNVVSLLNKGNGFVPSVVPELVNQMADSTSNPAAAVPNGVYDLFLWWNNALPTPAAVLSRGPAWQNNTTRAATGVLSRNSQGIITNSFDITNGPKTGFGLHVGTVMTDSAGATVTHNPGNTNSDSVTVAALFGLQNRFNGVDAPFICFEPTSSWTPSTAIGPVNGNNKLRVTAVRGFEEDAVRLRYAVSLNSSQLYVSALALDSTTSIAGDAGVCLTSIPNINAATSQSECDMLMGIGVHYIQFVESAPTGSGGAVGGRFGGAFRSYVAGRVRY